jgi:hypothetical protein
MYLFTVNKLIKIPIQINESRFIQLSFVSKFFGFRMEIVLY